MILFIDIVFRKKFQKLYLYKHTSISSGNYYIQFSAS